MKPHNVDRLFLTCYTIMGQSTKFAPSYLPTLELYFYCPSFASFTFTVQNLFLWYIMYRKEKLFINTLITLLIIIDPILDLSSF